MNNILKSLLFSASALAMTACSNNYMAYQNSPAGRAQANRAAYNPRTLQTHARTTPNTTLLQEFSNNGCSGDIKVDTKPLLKPEVKKIKPKRKHHGHGGIGLNKGPF